MKNRVKFGIAKRLAVSFTAALLIFVVLLGTVFSVLLYRNSKRAYEANLRSVAAGIGEMIRSMSLARGSFTLGDKNNAGPWHGQGDGQYFTGDVPGTNPGDVPDDVPGGDPGAVPGDGSGEFHGTERPGAEGDGDEMFRPGGEVRLTVDVLSRLISRLTNAGVWLIAPDESGESYDMLLMMRNDSYTDTEYENLPENNKKFIETVFEGYRAETKSFGSLFDEGTISVGEPILRKDGTVMGAVIIHAPSEGIFEGMKSGLITMAISLVAALAFGIIASVILSKRFSKPLVKINDTAAMIAEGDYSARTEVTRNDEIGKLAETIDDMGAKLQAANEESEKLQNLRQGFIANISHELRTPVTVMRGSLEALCDGVVKDPELIKQYHGEMLKESKYMQRMVNDLLDLSRLQNPDFSLNISEFNLCDCISDAVRSARRVADAKGLQVNYEYDAAEYMFKGDYDRVRQMLLIVLDNAVKFTDDVSHPVTVSLREGSVEVTNTGRGITAEELPYVFERFYRSRSEDNKNGTGLGLSIARQIALRHGVGVSVSSVPGGETTFVFDFKGGGVA